MFQLFRAVHRIDRHHHGIKTQNCKMRDHQLRTVLHVQHHAITFLHTHLAQSRSNFFSFKLQLRISPSSAHEDQSHILGIAQCTDVQIHPQRCLRCCQLVRQSFRPKSMVGGHSVSLQQNT